MIKALSIIGRCFKGDRWIIYAVIFLCITSVLVVYSSTTALAYQKMGGDTGHYLIKNVTMLLGGMVLMGFMSNVHPRFVSGFAEIALGVSVLLLIAATFMGTSINDSSRWIRVGGFTFQPSEIAKISLMIFTAKQLAWHDKEPDKAFVPIIVATGFVCGFILLENLSTFLLVTTSVVIMMIIGRISVVKIGALGGIVAIVLGLTIYFAPVVKDVFPPAKRAVTWRARIERFVSGDEETSQNGVTKRREKTQEEQALTAVSTGGLAGVGPGNSYMKNFLPMAYSDFIYSTILEEYGAWGGLLVLLAYFVILARARDVARHSKKPFHLYTMYGLAVLLTLQALINMMVGVGLMPVTGQTLPMVSMGGSSNLITGMAYGIMLSVSAETQRLNEAEAKAKTAE